MITLIAETQYLTRQDVDRLFNTFNLVRTELSDPQTSRDITPEFIANAHNQLLDIINSSGLVGSVFENTREVLGKRYDREDKRDEFDAKYNSLYPDYIRQIPDVLFSNRVVDKLLAMMSGEAGSATSYMQRNRPGSQVSAVQHLIGRALRSIILKEAKGRFGWTVYDYLREYRGITSLDAPIPGATTDDGSEATLGEFVSDAEAPATSEVARAVSILHPDIAKHLEGIFGDIVKNIPDPEAIQNLDSIVKDRVSAYTEGRKRLHAAHPENPEFKDADYFISHGDAIAKDLADAIRDFIAAEGE